MQYAYKIDHHPENNSYPPLVINAGTPTGIPIQNCIVFLLSLLIRMLL